MSMISLISRHFHSSQYHLFQRPHPRLCHHLQLLLPWNLEHSSPGFSLPSSSFHTCTICCSLTSAQNGSTLRAITSSLFSPGSTAQGLPVLLSYMHTLLKHPVSSNCFAHQPCISYSRSFTQTISSAHCQGC